MSKKKVNSVVRIWEQFPATVAEWAYRNVKAQWSDDVEHFHVSLKNDGYHLNIKEDWYMGLSEEHRSSALLHAVSHIVRGDCLIPKDMAGYNDPKLQHLATDALINQNQSLHDFADNNGGLRIGNSVEVIGKQLNPLSFSWMSTYNELKAEQQQQGGGDGEGGGGGDGDQEGEGGGNGEGGDGDNLPDTIDDTPSSEGDRDQLRKKHASAVLDARKALKGTELESAINANINASNSVSSRAKIELPPALDTKIPNAIIKAAGTSGVRLRERSYKRPGRVQGLKGVTRPPIAKIVCALDVSGSMTGYWDVVGGAAASLRKQFDVDLATFSDTCKKYVAGSDIENWSGGTLVTPVFEYGAKSKADVLAVFTDAEFFDFDPRDIAFDGKILFFVPEGFRTSHLDSVGQVIRLGKR